jgi:hypothetical protein
MLCAQELRFTIRDVQVYLAARSVVKKEPTEQQSMVVSHITLKKGVVVSEV